MTTCCGRRDHLKPLPRSISPKNVTDFSTEVIPAFIGKIATWHNDSIHRDIGTIDSLLKAQLDNKPSLPWPDKDEWQISFDAHNIHRMIGDAKITKQIS